MTALFDLAPLYGARKKLRQLLVELRPNHCWFCDARGMPNQDLCQSCGNDLPLIGNCCRLCAEPLLQHGVCGRCSKRAPRWSRLHVPLRYELPVDHLIRRFKYNADACAGRLCGALLASALPDCTGQLVMPVPMHKKRYIERGFNHAAVLAKDVARAQNLTFWPAAIRLRETDPQAAMDVSKRRQNVRGAFAVAPPPQTRQSVLLIDDVITTGETLMALSHACRRAGYGGITVACVARGGRARR